MAKKRSREGNFGGQAENANRRAKAEAIEGKRQKREIDELIKKLALQESALRRIASELNTLKLGEQREKKQAGRVN